MSICPSRAYASTRNDTNRHERSSTWSQTKTSSSIGERSREFDRLLQAHRCAAVCSRSERSEVTQERAMGIYPPAAWAVALGLTPSLSAASKSSWVPSAHAFCHAGSPITARAASI